MKTNYNSGFLKINQIVQFLTYSDLLILSGWGLITPFLVIFFAEGIKDGSIAAAGFATTIYFVSKSIFQLPIARVLDQRKGEKDDYFALLVGSFLISFCALLFYFIEWTWQVYIVQAIYGFASALAYPSWNAIFSRHLDKNKEAIEWSFYDTAVSVGIAISAALGGLMLTYFDYRMVFLIVGFISGVGSLFIVGIQNYLNKK